MLLVTMLGYCIAAVLGDSSIKLCGINNQSTNYVVDCQHCHLTLVPTNLPGGTTHLLLNNNHIRYVTPATFVDLSYLEHLDLSYNQISKLDNDSFLGLHNLTYLNLDYNKLCLNYNSYPPGLFKYTPLLRVLKMYGKPDCRQRYPEITIQHLDHLEELTLPTAKSPKFGKGFSNLHNLKKLTFSKESCKIGSYLNENIFANLAHLPIEEIVMVKCHMSNINLKTFSKFQHLKTLNLACNNDLQLSETMEAVKQIPSQLDTLVLDGMHRATYFSDIPADLFCGKTLSKLRRLSFRDNPGVVDPNCIMCLLNLEEITLGFNTWYPKHHSTYNWTDLLDTFLRRTAIKTIDASYFGHVIDRQFRRIFCDNTQYTTTEEYFRHPPEYMMNYPTNNNISDIKKHSSTYFEQMTQSIIAFYLDHADISNHDISLYSIKILNIHLLNFSYILNPYILLDFGAISGLQNLQVIDVSHCGIISIDIKANFSGLLELYANNNKLGSDTAKLLKSLFDQTPKLEILDLSHNELAHIHTDLFASLSMIKHLILKYNKIQQTDWIIINLGSLYVLDLSYNRIEYLKHSLMEELNLKEEMQINLEGNPFVCNCTSAFQSEILPFLEWIQQRTTCVVNKMHYMCARTSTALLQVDILSVIDSCPRTHKYKFKTDVHQTRLFHVSMPVGLSALICASIFICLTVYYKWRLRWVVYQIKYKGCRHFFADDNSYTNAKYDIFVIYAGRDDDASHWVVHELLPQCNHWNCLLCFEGRDFQVGVPKADVIIEAIDKSTKILIILSESFIQDQWCWFGLQMCITIKGLDQIILCQLDDIDVERTPRVLAKLMDIVPCLRYVDYRPGKFWNKFKHLIPHQER